MNKEVQTALFFMLGAILGFCVLILIQVSR